MWGREMTTPHADVKKAAPAAILTAEIPGIEWVHGDDLCDCTFQRIGEWTNPYIASTLRVRFCCIWEELFKQFPEFVQRIPAYYDGNSKRFVAEPWDWDAEYDMPRALWHRHVAAKEGWVRPLAEIRAEKADEEPPKAVRRQRAARSNHRADTYILR